MSHNEQEEPKKELTLDDLARMVQEGFAQTASKEELHALRIEFKGELALLRQDIDAGFLDLRHELPSLKEKLPNVETDVTDHELRIKALERHTGIGKK